MSKKVVVVEATGKTTEVIVSDDNAARPYEDLPFEADHVTSVTVTEAD